MIAKTPGPEAAILSRVIALDDSPISADVAKAFLAFQFSEADKRQMAALAEKARLGELTAEEEEWARAYERIGSFLGLLQSKARISIKQQVGAAK